MSVVSRRTVVLFLGLILASLSVCFRMLSISIESSRVNRLKIMTCDMCFTRNYHFLNEPLDVCGLQSQHSSWPQLEMVMTIPSHPSDVRIRDVLRSTWVSYTENNTHPHVRHVFLLGATSDPHQQTLVDKESHRFQDIVQQSYLDTYHNLTLKSLSMLDWATKSCPNARYIFKVDQDVFVNVGRVLSVVQSEWREDALLGKSYFHHAPIRDKTDKWYMSTEQFPLNEYPPYCGGPRYLVPMQIAPALRQASPNTPRVDIEDVYMGLVLEKTPYTVRNAPKLYYADEWVSLTSPCYMANTVTTYHEIPLQTLMDFWKRCHQS